ncbi:hypothetical protein C1J01_44925 [Nonomuraea aridisoli]|uniref:Uncharacterized protein n=1 Tax=Nonomuraea aridisoli TaxID=2070368 RepID=A0A2W2DJN7_9ACTN|nr:hypothetical protein C1J01_44925 [Nonomuraea aridisoli]
MAASRSRTSSGTRNNGRLRSSSTAGATVGSSASRCTPASRRARPSGIPATRLAWYHRASRPRRAR